jgi:sulfur carrier protein
MAYQKHFAPEPPTLDALKRSSARALRMWDWGNPGEKLKIVLPDGSRKELIAQNTTIEDVLKRLGINPVEVIVAKNGRIVSEEETAGDGDELKIVMVVHGG